MAKLKIVNRYGITPNEVLNNKDLSWKAKGLYGYIQSKPEDWDFAVNRITEDAKDGRDWTANGIKELEDVWYLKRRKFKNEKGQWDIEYTLYDTITENTERVNNETITENPLTENPSTENTETNKERNTNKEKSNKEIYFDDEKLNIIFLEFIEHRRQIKSPMTDLAKTKMINQIIKWKEKYKIEQIIDFINLSITNGWKWVFEKKSAGGQKKDKLAYESGDRENFTF